MLNNNFKTISANRISAKEFENYQNEYLNTADARMILLAYSNSKDFIIVTEETRTSNDNKVFKKIPSICELLKIQVKTLPEYLKDCKEIQITFEKYAK